MIELQEHVTILHQLLLDVITNTKETDANIKKNIEEIFSIIKNMYSRIDKLEESIAPLAFEIE